LSSLKEMREETVNMKEDTCPICDKGTLKKQVKDKVFKYKGESITIPGYVTYNCDICGDAVVDNGTLRESGKILKDFQRTVDGLLTAMEIKAIRKKLHLTQEEMADIVGGGLKGFARYETGQVCQSRGMDNLLRILDAYPFALNIIRKNMTKMPADFMEKKVVKIDFTKAKKGYVSKPIDYTSQTEELSYGT